MTFVPNTPVKFDSPGEWKPVGILKCRRCGAADVKYRVHESSCGAWEDDEYRCFTCHHTWFVDGIDS